MVVQVVVVQVVVVQVVVVHCLVLTLRVPTGRRNLHTYSAGIKGRFRHTLQHPFTDIRQISYGNLIIFIGLVFSRGNSSEKRPDNPQAPATVG